MVKLSWILTQESGMDVELLIISQIRLVKWDISGLPCPRCHWLDRYLFLGNLKAFLKALKMQPSIDSLAESSIWSRARASARPVQVIFISLFWQRIGQSTAGEPWAPGPPRIVMLITAPDCKAPWRRSASCVVVVFLNDDVDEGVFVGEEGLHVGVEFAEDLLDHVPRMAKENRYNARATPQLQTVLESLHHATDILRLACKGTTQYLTQPF
jgi:hypothetical protein